MENASKSNQSVQLNVDEFVREMRLKMERELRAVAEAVNAAPDGAWINGSEMEVRDIFGRMREDAYQKALQMRLDAAQAAFSPAGRGDRSAPGKQGT